MNAVKIMGCHTAAAIKKLELPPFQINCGSRTRPLDAIEVLQLEKVKRHDVEFDGKFIGRVVLVEGDYHYGTGKSGTHAKDGMVRIVIYETEMGMAADEIISKEMIACTKMERIGVHPGLVQIRVGTSGGINSMGFEAPVIKLGDIVVANANVGFSGTVLQSFGYTPLIDWAKASTQSEQEAQEFLACWQGLGGKITGDGKYLVNYNSPAVVDAAVKAAAEWGVRVHSGGCFSKDSLYMEGNEEKVAALRTAYKDVAGSIIVTEMEQLANAAIAMEHGKKYGNAVHTGAVLAVIGALPGEGFPEEGNEQQAKQAAEAEKNALKVAADALGIMKERIAEHLLS